jgi:uncharacterized small protein (DUF1192 family)
MIEDDRPRRVAPLALESLAVTELTAYIVELRAEIARAEAEIARKEKLRVAAAAFFRPPA